MAPTRGPPGGQVTQGSALRLYPPPFQSEQWPGAEIRVRRVSLILAVMAAVEGPRNHGRLRRLSSGVPRCLGNPSERRLVDLAWEVGEGSPGSEAGTNLPCRRVARPLGMWAELTQAQEPGGAGTHGAQAPRMPLLSEVRGSGGPQVMGGPSKSLGRGFRLPSFPRGEVGPLPTGQQTLPEVGVLGKARTPPEKQC